MNDSTNLIPAAVKLAAASDVAILVVGDNQETCEESWGGRTGDNPEYVSSISIETLTYSF